MNRSDREGMWDEEDGFYYDILRLPDGSARRLKVRSMVGLLPLCATTVIEKWQRDCCPRAGQFLFQERLAAGCSRSSCGRCTRPARGTWASPSGGLSRSCTRFGSAGS